MNTASINPKVVLFIASFAAFIATFNETYLNVVTSRPRFPSHSSFGASSGCRTQLG
ncbi:MAG TPA: hypothetical protein O0Y08_06260 [Methanocorpusculum sp.]|nr:hypothetical protein [Methanocorpusculum sp.]